MEKTWKLLMVALICAVTVHGESVSETAEKPVVKTGNPQVELITNHGRIVLELFEADAPLTVENFLTYVDEAFYDGLVFHRVIKGFMIQGGGMDADMKQKANHGTIKNEAGNGLKNEKGTVAMARTPDPHSASSQFFINVADNVFLNYRSPKAEAFGYCVFGKVIEGMDVVGKIAKVKTGNRGYQQNVPNEPVVIEKAARVTPEP